MAATSNPRNAADAGLTISGVNHFTLPVRDHEKSRQFYINILGGEVTREPNWDSVRAGRSNSTAMAVLLCEGIDFDLFWQPFGMGAADQYHPNHAFYVQSADELKAYKGLLEETGVPTVLVAREPTADLKTGDECFVEMHFRDPDGNHLEIDCRSYPFGEEVQTGEIDLWDTNYSWREWPQSR